MKLTFLDFCAGIGAGRLGLEQAGLTCVAHSEINPDADYTYNLFHNDKNNLGDLTKLKLSDIPDADVMIAGFPCQTFSIVGKRRGFDDDRGQIIYYLANILRGKNIPYFILENVKGLTNHNGGQTLRTILDLLDSVGYKTFFRVLNSADYGIPQIRERVYFIGVRKDLYHGEFVFPTPCPRNYKVQDFLCGTNNNFLDLQDATFQRYLNNKYNKGRVDIDKILHKDYVMIDTRQSDLRTYENVCPTLRTGRHGILYTRGGCLVRLSAPEALRIQGFPLSMADMPSNLATNKLLAQAGNAMTVDVIAALGRQLVAYHNQGNKNESTATGVTNG